MSLRAQALRANIADPRGRPALLLGALALGLAAFCVAYTNWSMVVENGGPSIEGFDDTGYYIWARSMVIDGDLDFENDVASAPTIPEDARALWLEELPRSPTGRVTNKYPPGWALASLPAFLAGHAWALVSEAPEDGWSRPYFVAVWIWQLALGGLGLWWAWKVTARFAPPPIAATAVLAMWIASPMIYYHTARIGMAHGLLFTLLAGVHHHTFALREGRNEIWRWATLGGLSALAALTRSTAVLFLLFPALVVFSRLRAQNGSQRGRPLAALLAPWAAAGVFTLLSVWAVHGRFYAEAYPGETFYYHDPQIREVLFSAWHGLFYWHPLLLAGMAGLVVGMWRRDLPRSWSVSVLALVYINAAWWCWWFGSSFGSRSFEGVVLLAMPGLAWLLARVPDSRIVRLGATALIGAGVAAGGVLLLLFLTQSIPREEPVTHAEMAAAALRWLGF